MSLFGLRWTAFSFLQSILIFHIAPWVRWIIGNSSSVAPRRAPTSIISVRVLLLLGRTCTTTTMVIWCTHTLRTFTSATILTKSSPCRPWHLLLHLDIILRLRIVINDPSRTLRHKLVSWVRLLMTSLLAQHFSFCIWRAATTSATHRNVFFKINIDVYIIIVSSASCMGPCRSSIRRSHFVVFRLPNLIPSGESILASISLLFYHLVGPDILLVVHVSATHLEPLPHDFRTWLQITRVTRTIITVTILIVIVWLRAHSVIVIYYKLFWLVIAIYSRIISQGSIRATNKSASTVSISALSSSISFVARSSNRAAWASRGLGPRSNITRGWWLIVSRVLSLTLTWASRWWESIYKRLIIIARFNGLTTTISRNIYTRLNKGIQLVTLH